MVELWIIFFLMLVMLRFIAPYDSRYMKGKYVEIKNPILRSLLIDKMGFWDKTNRRKKDINKITILGIVLYIYAAVSAILAILSYVFVSKSQVEPIIIESEELDFQLDTLNELYAGSFLASFFSSFIVLKFFRFSFELHRFFVFRLLF